jgi:hypothetical protein
LLGAWLVVAHRHKLLVRDLQLTSAGGRPIVALDPIEFLLNSLNFSEWRERQAGRVAWMGDRDGKLHKGFENGVS